jgi:hypothetical protein
MPVRDRYDPEHEVLLLEIDGKVRDEDLVAYAQRAAGNPAIPPGHDELVDLRGVESEDGVQSHTLRRIASLFSDADRGPERSRVALVASADVAYGLSRMYQAFRADSPLDLRVFREMSEARAWLGLPPEAE